MSRNLCTTRCDYLHGGDPQVILLEEPRPITREDAGAYFPEYEGMLVANAECALCKAQYLAWVDETARTSRNYRWDHYGRRASSYCPFVDLSFRSSFNDEPGEQDLPLYRVDQFGERCGFVDPTKLDYFGTDLLDRVTQDFRQAILQGQKAWYERLAAEIRLRGGFE